jgi:acetyl esterase/lipase
LTQGLLYAASKWYIPADEDPKKPIYSPIYGDFKDIGFITMFMGTHESLLLQSDILDKKLTDEHIDHKYYVGQDMFHVWILFTLKESKEPFELISNLIKN